MANTTRLRRIEKGIGMTAPNTSTQNHTKASSTEANGQALEGCGLAHGLVALSEGVYLMGVKLDQLAGVGS